MQALAVRVGTLALVLAVSIHAGTKVTAAGIAASAPARDAAIQPVGGQRAVLNARAAESHRIAAVAVAVAPSSASAPAREADGSRALSTREAHIQSLLTDAENLERQARQLFVQVAIRERDAKERGQAEASVQALRAQAGSLLDRAQHLRMQAAQERFDRDKVARQVLPGPAAVPMRPPSPAVRHENESQQDVRPAADAAVQYKKMEQQRGQKIQLPPNGTTSGRSVAEVQNKGKAGEQKAEDTAPSLPIVVPPSVSLPEIRQPEPRVRPPREAARHIASAAPGKDASRVAEHAGSKAAADAFAAEARRIDGLVTGSVAVSAPQSAEKGEDFTVYLRVSRDKLDELLKGLQDDHPENMTMKGKSGIKLTPRMSAIVSGFDCEIAPKEAQVQSVGGAEPTTFSWGIKPLKKGMLKLTFKLAGTLNVEGKEVPRDFYEYEQEVDVKVGVMAVVEEFIGENWQWVATTLAIPAVGALWAFLRKKKDVRQPSAAAKLKQRRRQREPYKLAA